MSKNFLKQKPINLPTYVYSMTARVALVHYREAYRLKNYIFSDIPVVANQPLRAGDVVSNNCCYYGNKNVEILEHMKSKGILRDVGDELKYYYGCQIDSLNINYVDEGSIASYNGYGCCTVFVELSCGATNKRYRQLDERYQELDVSEHIEREVLIQHDLESRDIDYWKNRLKDWDEKLEYIGEIPKDLIY